MFVFFFYLFGLLLIMGKNKSIFISSLRELIIFEVEKQNLDEVNKDSCLCFLYPRTVCKMKYGAVKKSWQVSFYFWQITWRGEIKEQFEKMKNRSSVHMQNLQQLQKLDEELIRRRKEELRWEQNKK